MLTVPSFYFMYQIVGDNENLKSNVKSAINIFNMKHTIMSGILLGLSSVNYIDKKTQYASVEKFCPHKWIRIFILANLLLPNFIEFTQPSYLAI